MGQNRLRRDSECGVPTGDIRFSSKNETKINEILLLMSLQKNGHIHMLRLKSIRMILIKVAMSASLMNFAPELFFADISTLPRFHRIEIENNSILAEFSPLGAFLPDLIFIGFQPVIPCKGYNLF